MGSRTNEETRHKSIKFPIKKERTYKNPFFRLDEVHLINGHVEFLPNQAFHGQWIIFLMIEIRK